MKPDISVIIPVYNTGIILKDTIDSVLNQTFDNFELILVDDGSTDISRSICDEYAKKDDRIKVYHKKNGGICDARNFGIEKSIGRYITFCDHDDLYMPEKLKVQFEAAESSGADVVSIGHIVTFDYKNDVEYYGENIRCFAREEIAPNINFIINSFDLTIWDKLYRRDSLINYLFFNTKYKKGHEDICFNLSIYAKINSFVGIKTSLYNHIIRKSLSTSFKVYEELIEAMINTILLYDKCIKELYGNVDIYMDDYNNQLSKYLRSLFIYAGKLSYNKVDFCILKAKTDSIVDCSNMRISKIDNFKDKIIIFLYKRKNTFWLFILCRLIAKIKDRRQKYTIG